MKTICWKCNHEMELLRQKVTHTLFNKDIDVHNVPMYQCTNCSNTFYLDTRKLIEQLEEAYRQGKNEIVLEG